MSKKFGVNQEKVNDTSSSNHHLGQNQKMNICELSLMMPRKEFEIFEEDMTETIYENYLLILGVTERWVASQPRANRIIPLSEKEYSQ